MFFPDQSIPGTEDLILRSENLSSNASIFRVYY